MKDIVIIANFCRDFSETDNGRFMYLCKELSKDNEVEIITSDFSHRQKKHKDPLTIHWPFKITFLYEPGYKRNISIQRFLSHRIWGINVKKYIESRKKPDVIYCAVPSLTAPFFTSKYCKKNGVKFIIDIQDLWPEAFRLVINIPIISDIIFAPFTWYANKIYKMADSICAVSETYADRAMKVNKKNVSKQVVFLGTNLKTFDNNIRRNLIKKPEDEIWIGYCGTLGASYDITVVIDALHIIKRQGVKAPKFIIMGDGERRKEFEEHAKGLKIECAFMGNLPYDKMCGWLSACDIAVNPIMHNAAQSIINKHGDYAAAGLPVISTQENQEYRNLIEEFQMGFNVSNNDAIEFADKLQEIIENIDLRKTMEQGARRCAEERFDRERSYQKLIETILDK